ncbi:MAG: type II toxin-antitoxin system HipA family toxin [Flammeovirgaceae bacterium]|jgi:serine/threonine-protein kinase HipA|nr:type II toxin-antitoxin system HipA family toxin [Flammeovirgaceae bacterium]
MAKHAQQRSIQVYAGWKDLEQPTLMGILYATQVRGKEVFSFNYAEAWLQSKNAQSLDPDLQLYSGPQYLGEGKSNFGIFLDSSPDRWGRVLMDRREALLARRENRKARTLFETDYLLGVFDGHRMGALRFKEDDTGDFLNDNKEMASPPWTSIRELEEASIRLEDDDDDETEKMKWLNMLMAPGSSLGGARPKASVLDRKGQLWIAKFPSRNDNKDIGAWEKVVHDLAKKSSLHVAEALAESFYSKQHTFLTKRFDRNAKGERTHFASAMTLLGQTDGTNYKHGVSYLDLAEFIIRNGAQPNQDLEELWRRIVFYICVSNTDDHLRNHGFLLTPNGWKLSPAYDINPVETGTGLSLNISETDNALDLDLARDVAPYFRVSAKKAEQIINGIKKAVSNWKDVATKQGISKREQEMMAHAFRQKE